MRPPALRLHRRYECTVCTTGASAACTVAPQCDSELDGSCQCTLSGLEPATSHNVTCVAIKPGGTRSPASNVAALTTDLAP